MRKSGLLALFVCTVVGSLPGQATAQETVAGITVHTNTPTRVEEPRLDRPEWGTTALGVRTIPGLSFQESDSSMIFTYSGVTGLRHRSGAGFFQWFDAALPDLPPGAEFVGLELEGCDTSATHSMTAIIFYRDAPLGPNNSIGSVTTGVAATPGCAFFGGTANLPPAVFFVDNRNKSYWVRVELTATDSTTMLSAVRVYYRLRVSPAPGAATFADVPVSNPLFKFVEALVASGVTGGCGGGNYCPDAPVTRGQMAVFLSTALGLHFPF